MRFDSSTFYSIIGVVPFRKKYLHSTSVLSSLSSFSNTSKVTIRGWLTQPSSPLKKTPLPPEVRQNCLREQSLRQLPSCLPARAGAAAQKTEHPQRKKIHQVAGAAEMERLDSGWFCSGWGNDTACHKVQRKGKDAALGCSPGMLPHQHHHPPSTARGDLPVPC